MNRRTKGIQMPVSFVGIGLAANVFALDGADEAGKLTDVHPVVRRSDLMKPPLASHSRFSDQVGRIEDWLSISSPRPRSP